MCTVVFCQQATGIPQNLPAEHFPEKSSACVQIHWLRIILDEGHMLGASLGMTSKLQMAVSLRAERRWVMTGTLAVLADPSAYFQDICCVPLVFWSCHMSRELSCSPFPWNSFGSSSRLVMDLLCAQAPLRPTLPHRMWLTCSPCSHSWATSPMARNARFGRWVHNLTLLLIAHACQLQHPVQTDKHSFLHAGRCATAL